MALINCPECNKEISNKANSCPHCGYPLSNMQKSSSVLSNSDSDTYDIILTDCGEKKINVIKYIRTLNNLSLSEAKEIVDSVNEKPYKLYTNVLTDEARQAEIGTHRD